MSFSERDLHYDSLQPINAWLGENYNRIDSRARETIINGLAVDNPQITGEVEDRRYFISAIGMLEGDLDGFLGVVSKRIAEVEPDVRFTPDGGRHLTLTEMLYSPNGRRSSGVTASAARQYYAAARAALQEREPIGLILQRIIVSIDREQDSVSVAGAFLLENDDFIRLRGEIREKTKAHGLSATSSTGEVNAILATLGRFGHPPQRVGNTIPLFEVIDQANEELPERLSGEVKKVNVISTATSPKVADGFVYLTPPLTLGRYNPSVSPNFATAKSVLKEG